MSLMVSMNWGKIYIKLLNIITKYTNSFIEYKDWFVYCMWVSLDQCWYIIPVITCFYVFAHSGVKALHETSFIEWNQNYCHIVALNNNMLGFHFRSIVAATRVLPTLLTLVTLLFFAVEILSASSIYSTICYHFFRRSW